MSNLDPTTLEPLCGVLRTQAIAFKDEGETPEGLPIGSLRLAASGAPIFPDGRWLTLAEARAVAQYFGVELIEA